MVCSLKRANILTVIVLITILLSLQQVRCEDRSEEFYNCLESLIAQYPDHQLRGTVPGTVADEGKNINTAKALQLFRESPPVIPSSFAWGLELRTVSDALIDSIVLLAFEYEFPDIDLSQIADSCSALGRYAIAERIADSIPGAYSKCSAYRFLAERKIASGDTADAIRLLDKIMAVPAEPNVQSNICVWADAGVLYWRCGDSLSAHGVLNRAKTTAPTDVIRGHVANSYNDVAEAYFEIGAVDSIYPLVALLASVPFGASEIDKIIQAAIERSDDKLALFGIEHLRDSKRQFEAWLLLAESYRKLGSCDTAKSFLNESSLVLETLEEDQDKCWNICNLAEELLQCGYAGEAQQLLAESERIARTLPIREHDGLEFNMAASTLHRIAEVQLCFGDISEGSRLLIDKEEGSDTYDIVSQCYHLMLDSGDSSRAEKVLSVVSETEVRDAIRATEEYDWFSSTKNCDRIAMLPQSKNLHLESRQDSLSNREWQIGLLQDPENRLLALLDLADDFLDEGDSTKAKTLAAESGEVFLEMSFIEMEDTISFRLVDLLAELGDSTSFIASVAGQSFGGSRFNVTLSRLARRYIESNWCDPLLESIRATQATESKTLLAAFAMAWIYLLEPQVPTCPQDYCSSLMSAVE